MFVTRTGAELSARTVKTSTVTDLVSNPSSDLISSTQVEEAIASCIAHGSHGAYDFKYQYLLNEISSKLPIAGIPAEVRRDNAILKMMESEATCLNINTDGFRPHLVSGVVEGVMLHAKRWIASVLGNFDYGLFETAKFTNGASTSRRRKKADPFYKYNPKIDSVHVTPAAFGYGFTLMSMTPLWLNLPGNKIKTVSGNRITTVPKKTDCDRCIAMEPDLNMAFQLCIGKSIRQSLKSVGITLTDQTVNQRLAKLGSIDGSLATIDLSSASDSISYRLVMELLPFPWFDVLDNLRSPIGEMPDGSHHSWNKFSSMGNGYTFELESLLFASIMYGVSRHMFDEEMKFGESHGNAVYGDDLICHTYKASSVISVLYSFGFDTNKDKTFISGQFRESCGKHYFSGTDVTPIYIRKPIDNTSRLCWLANAIRRWSYDEYTEVCDSQCYPLWRQISKMVPKALKGGCDIYSSAYVVSPGKPKSLLVNETKVREINGPAALLRCFQGMRNVNHYDVHWRDITVSVEYRDDIANRYAPTVLIDEYESKYDEFLYDPSAAVDNTVLSIPMPGRYRTCPNRELWRPIPLFSEELE